MLFLSACSLIAVVITNQGVDAFNGFIFGTNMETKCIGEMHTFAPSCQMSALFSDMRSLDAKYQQQQKQLQSLQRSLTIENITLKQHQTEIDYLSVRMSNGSTEYSGEVEVYVRGHWGTVCDHGWDNNDANVFCKMIGYASGVMTGDHASTGKPHLMTDLNCHGHESSVFDCQYTTLVDSSPCTNGNSAAVICDIGVRLQDFEKDSLRGRVEISHLGQWGTICDDNWSDQDATVVCRMLGYRSGRALPKATFGAGTGLILLDDVTCLGTERTLLQCQHAQFGANNCNHAEDAAVVCTA